MTREDVYELIPEHALLHDLSLKEKCADIWIEVLEGSDWQKNGNVKKCPIAVMSVSSDCPENNISHTGLVTRLCCAVYENMGDYFRKIGPCNREYLIAGALIHDVGKFLEYEFKDGKIGYSPTGKMFRHPCSGAYLSQKHGMPDIVTHMILSHSFALSPEGAKAKNTPESVILKYVDDMVFNYARIFYPSNIGDNSCCQC